MRFNSLRTRILLSMILLVLLALVVIGVTTAVFFKQKNEEYHRERLLRKENQVTQSIAYFLKDVSLARDLETVIRPFDEKIRELADINNLEINIYNTRGEIVLSSHMNSRDSLFFEKRITEDVISRLAKEENGQFIDEDESGQLLYGYSYIMDNGANILAIMQVPYLQTDQLNRRELNDFLTRLVQIFGLLLVGAIVLAFVLSNSITKSLKIITEKIRATNFVKHNQPIEYQRNDEIGTLVKEYNGMIQQLEESRAELAKNERESAWREMAKQVAHEIKNPLTPMKLSLQYLQRAWQQKDDEFDNKLNKTSDTIIEQIDTLSNIASEFSDFAKMPKAAIEQVDFANVVEAAVELYSDNANAISATCSSKPIWIAADREQLNRVCSNLITNAIQATDDHGSPRIQLNLTTESGFALLIVQDNGIGVPEEIQDKIFQPNFTTKSSGMGLGLAMCQQIISSFNGKIWFETEVKSGTTFFVRLPLA